MSFVNCDHLKVNFYHRFHKYNAAQHKNEDHQLLKISQKLTGMPKGGYETYEKRSQYCSFRKWAMLKCLDGALLFSFAME